MKKTLIICLITVLLCLAGMAMLLVSLPSLGSYAISKLTGYEVHISKIDYKYSDGDIVVSLNDLKVKGKADGYVKKWILSAGIKGGLRLKSVNISDFDIKLPDAKAKTRFVPLFAETLEMKNGRIVYGNQIFTVHLIKIDNLKPETPFTFEMLVDNDLWLKSIRASGEGTYSFRGGTPDMKGHIEATHLNLNKLSDKLQGKANIKGTFTLSSKREFTLNGPFEIFGYEEKSIPFRNTFSVERVTGETSINYTENAIDIKMGKMLFKGTPVGLNLKFEKNELAHLELNSGFLDLKDIKQYLALENLTKTPFNIWDYLYGGKVKITSFTLSKSDVLNAELELRNGEIGYKTLLFQNVAGLIGFDKKSLKLTNVKGDFKTSAFKNISGTIPFSAEKDVSIKGNYAFNLKDVPSLLDLGDLSFRKGATDGTVALGGNKKIGFVLSGSGRVNNADATWKKVSANANGSYKFTNDEIEFDPLTLSKGSTNITIKGKWKKNFMDLKIKGGLDVIHAEPLTAAMPLKMNGTADLDISVQRKEEWIKLTSDIVMDNLSFEFPGVVKKKSGTQSRANLEIIKDDNNISIEKLVYNLDIINLNLKGNIHNYTTINFDADLDAAGIERIASMFLFDNYSTQGNIKLNATVRDLNLPFRKLPSINGNLEVNNGIFRLPWMKKPFEKINLISSFRGDAFDITADSVKLGGSSIKKGVLTVEGLEYPRFLIDISMDNLEIEDLKSDKAFEIPVIYKKSLPAKASGGISIFAENVKNANKTAKNLKITGEFKDSKLDISALKMDYLDGQLDSHGSINFSDPLPHIYAKGKFNNFSSGLFMESFGGKSQIIQGKTTIFGNIETSGKSNAELIGSMKGNMAMYSRNGNIKRWNILSNIFGLLNVYDVFRKKPGMMKEGLSYNKLGANFRINEGIFNTNDFLIDSPSMLITGAGNLNANTREIDGTITVSPLVTVDRTIDKIPILRSIFKKTDKGFLSVSFRVNGQLENPEIRPTFTDNVGKKTIEVLKNIFVLPKGMIE